MGLLSFLSRANREAPAMVRLPSGSFTVDRTGRVIASTLASSFPADLVAAIGAAVLGTFQDAAAMQQPLNELVVHYPSLKITAREMRGGALIFLVPINLAGPAT
jgi:predicted regulator of Ras-like GTPase activity (Roadblock/LC7/MglB family)